jgi:diacylglycerol diphosphate phosphatase/phosphatidate phosphatase
MGFLSLYLAGKLHVFDQKGYTYKGFVVAAPLVIAILIAISRTEDYRHHWHDVFAGSLVGKYGCTFKKVNSFLKFKY